MGGPHKKEHLTPILVRTGIQGLAYMHSFKSITIKRLPKLGLHNRSWVHRPNQEDQINIKQGGQKNYQ